MAERTQLDDVMQDAGPSEVDSQPSYQVLTEARIPVSRHTGALWKSRRDQVTKFRQETGISAAWKQASDYYHNDQLQQRGDSDGTGLTTLRDKIDGTFAETENLVFANVSAAVPALYARNPDCTATTDDDALKPITALADKLADRLLNKRNAPGVNAKPKIRRAVTSAFLHNLGWLEVGWVNKEDSVEQARIDIQRISDKLADKKTSQQEIRKLEGQLLAIERRISLLSPSGPFLKYHKVDRIYRDPMGVEEDLSDCNWVMVDETWLTSTLNATFTRPSKSGRKLIYEPTHVLGSEEDATEEEINSFSLFNKNTEDAEGEDKFENYLRSATDKHVTRVWRIWDKATRRVYLYYDKDWTWPIWVYDDPYKFEDFFPYVPLHFYTSPRGGESKGEVAYYLDQQDAINFINSLTHKARLWSAAKIGYNTEKITEADFKRWLNSNVFEGVGFKLPDGTSMRDAISGLELPILNRPELLDKSGIYATIDRVGSVSDILRGQQFKTNTTNQAIQQYSQVNQTRFDSPIDAIEDFIGIICDKLLQLSFMYMSQEQVSTLIGTTLAQQWRNLSLEEYRMLSITITGGSTQKPTSQTKQAKALEIGQVLGQFASVNPLVVVVMLRVLSEAFNELTLTQQEWQMLIQTTMQAMTGAPPAGPEQAGSETATEESNGPQPQS